MTILSGVIGSLVHVMVIGVCVWLGLVPLPRPCASLMIENPNNHNKFNNKFNNNHNLNNNNNNNNRGVSVWVGVPSSSPSLTRKATVANDNDRSGSSNSNSNSNNNNQKANTLVETWADEVGNSALQTVTRLARSVAGIEGSMVDSSSLDAPTLAFPSNSQGNKKNNGNNNKLYSPASLYSEEGGKTGDQRVVINALKRLERDMDILENMAGEKPQLSTLELILLTTSVWIVATAPSLFAGYFKVTEVLAPAAATFCASIGIGAEFVGKVAVADGKEIAAQTLQCAAEAEGYLAQAERTKAILPLCVGIGATAATFTLLAPVIIQSLQFLGNEIVTELYLLCPLVSVLSAAVAGLSLQETQSQCARAISVGNRRFAKSGIVGRTWLSVTEQIEKGSNKQTTKWKSFAVSVLPAPLLGTLVPGALSTKTIVVGAVAACQSALYLAQAENTLARAADAVALKSRSAAVCDTYANQGARSSAILPFTSALSSLCAAATAAIVELPWVETTHNVLAQTVAVALFPTVGSLFAAAASVSKARCEVDTEAAVQAASTLALEYTNDKDQNDPLLRPFRGVLQLIWCTTTSTYRRIVSSTATQRWHRLLQPVYRNLSTLLRRLQTRFRFRTD